MPCTMLVLSEYLILNQVSLLCADDLGSGDMGSGFEMGKWGKLLSGAPEQVYWLQRPNLLAKDRRVLRDDPVGTVPFLSNGSR